MASKCVKSTLYPWRWGRQPWVCIKGSWYCFLAPTGPCGGVSLAYPGDICHRSHLGKELSSLSQLGQDLGVSQLTCLSFCDWEFMPELMVPRMGISPKLDQSEIFPRIFQTETKQPSLFQEAQGQWATLFCYFEEEKEDLRKEAHNWECESQILDLSCTWDPVLLFFFFFSCFFCELFTHLSSKFPLWVQASLSSVSHTCSWKQKSSNNYDF